MVTLRMANGAIATIAYLVGGDPLAPEGTDRDLRRRRDRGHRRLPRATISARRADADIWRTCSRDRTKGTAPKCGRSSTRSAAGQPVARAVRLGRQLHARDVRHSRVARNGELLSTSLSHRQLRRRPRPACRHRRASSRLAYLARIARVYANRSSGPLSFWYEQPLAERTRRSTTAGSTSCASRARPPIAGRSTTTACRCSTTRATSAVSTTRSPSRSTASRASTAGATRAREDDETAWLARPTWLER